MVVTLFPTTGIKCQVGDFNLLVDAPSGRKGDLILETETPLPINSFSAPEHIQGPGEYEVSGVRVRGVGLNSQGGKGRLKTAYSVELDGIRLGFLGEVGGALSDDTLDKLGEIDILFLSVDQRKFKAKQLVTLIKQVDPVIIVPTTDKTAKVLSEEIGQKIKGEEKLVIKKKDVDKEDKTQKLIWLKRK